MVMLEGECKEGETSESLFLRQEWSRCLESLSVPEQPAQLANRAFLYLKLGKFKKATKDASRLLFHESQDMRVRGWKIILAAAALSQDLDKVEQRLKAWEESAPTSTEMLQCRNLIKELMASIKAGIEISAAFSGIEESLGVSSEWITIKVWKFRPLPSSTQLNFTLCLPYRFGRCALGSACPDAHGEQEITEWNERRSLLDELGKTEIVENTQSVLLREMRATVGEEIGNDKPHSESSGVEAKCAQPLSVDSLIHKIYAWKFSIESQSHLTQICLLDDTYRQHFSIANAHFNLNPKINLISDVSGKTQLVEVSHRIPKKTKIFKYSVAIQFSSEVFGKFHQRVLFNSAKSGRSVQSISVNLIKEPEGKKRSGKGNHESILSTTPTWHLGNAEIKDGVTGDRIKSTTLIGFPLLPSRASPALKDEDPLTPENYVDKMRSFLTEEEKARQGILSKYNLSTRLKMNDKYNMGGTGETRYASHDSLYGQLKLFRDVSEDTAVGRLILRSCQNVLLCKSEDAMKAQEAKSNPTVYLCPIVDKSKNVLHVEMGHDIVKTLELKKDTTAAFDIQFQLDRTAFAEQKEVLVKLQPHHLNALFPDCSPNVRIPWNPELQWNEDVSNNDFELNPRQKEAFIAITTKATHVPPILLVGPFGTGKTFTLAKCIHKLATEPETRILICTHSNSAADLYIKEYSQEWTANEAKILRVYYSGRSLNTVHARVRAHCIISEGAFRPPTQQQILDAKVVVVTLSTSLYLLDLSLPDDTFTHIFLDEAAQAMEAEAVLPLASAGPLTRIVLAGDHLQLSPELFSTGGRELEGSLLERLHARYPDPHPCNLLLSKNYRSHSAIVSFASDAFYKRRLECAKEQPKHTIYYPLTLFTARGEEAQDEDSTSYYNISEVYEVVDRVKALLDEWPISWGAKKDESAIGVLTPYADQVTKIRSQLRSCGLHHVSVERVFNVQGKQFRAVFLSTVRSHKPWVRILPEAVGAEVDLGFFSNPKLLNTALTRAQSLVAVVGDPVSLLSFGKCRKLWEDFVKIVNENKSLFGITYEDIKKNIEGLEMRLTWGLNPLASEFQPKSTGFLSRLEKPPENGEKKEREEEKKHPPPLFPSTQPQVQAKPMVTSFEEYAKLAGQPIQQQMPPFQIVLDPVTRQQIHPPMKLIPQIPVFQYYNQPMFPPRLAHMPVPGASLALIPPMGVKSMTGVRIPSPYDPRPGYGKVPISQHGLIAPMPSVPISQPSLPNAPQFFPMPCPPEIFHPSQMPLQYGSQPGLFVPVPAPKAVVRQNQISPVQQQASISPFQPQQQFAPVQAMPYLQFHLRQPLHPSQAFQSERIRIASPTITGLPHPNLQQQIRNNNMPTGQMVPPLSSPHGPPDDYNRPIPDPSFLNSIKKAYMGNQGQESVHQTSPDLMNARHSPNGGGEVGWRGVGKEMSAWPSPHFSQVSLNDRRPMPLMSVQTECQRSSSVPSYANIVKKGAGHQMNGNHSNGYH